ncbi:aminopeptidase N [Drosophila sulfurigaster albostrigata]|uniref:aminopeptidase N n=1 Tax=Drosophila sulfurigaster albostrigata TaxID=89887 RepID=UPI002D218674|nr:aminopeptidase N [Drosophila sulfurigaster albostrigata]
MARVLVPLLVLFVAALSQASVLRQFPPEDFEGRQLLLENPNQRLETRDDEATYRLPNNTEPISYDVVLSTNVHTGETGFNGTVTITLEVIETSTTITVHARQLANFTASIIAADGQGTATQLQFTQDTDREFLSFYANDLTFTAGTTWLLTINYQGNLRTDNGGFYLSTYTDEEGTTKYLATTQFESTDARHAFPCYDEPAKRANFTITIHHDASYNAISNMPVNVEKSSAGITSFDTSVKMSSYLVAFIVSEFVSSSGEFNNLPQRVFSRKGTENEQEWALITGMLVEKRLSGYFDVPFALPKLDQAAIPDFAAGAMENWGLATYREEYLLYNSENSTVNTQTNIATIESHEDAHMWFGDLVAIEYWSYLWLKEGFATLFENLAVDLAYPAWDIFQTFHAGSYQNALVTDANPSTRPMTYFVEKPSEIALLYDNIAYAKAGSVLDMWRNALTNTVFQRGLHNYLEANKFSAANETHLFDAIALAAREENFAVPATINEMMSSWTRQGGVPLLTVTRNYNDGSFTVKQEQYTNDKDYNSTKLWYVPVNYALQSDPDFRNTTASHYLLNEAEITISDAKTIKDEWLILNKQSTGYYRINYDEDNWNLITDGLISRPHKIHPRNRAQIISDLYRFVTSGRVAHSTLLQLLTYLPKEDQYAPWSAVNTVITLFNRYLSGDEQYANFLFYVTELVSEQYDKFGVNDVHGEQHLAKFTRNVIINVACLAGVESCLSETKAKLQALVDAGTPIEANLQTPVYCNGLKQADDATFNFVFEKLMNSNDQAERRLLISALGCAQSQSQLEKYVASSIDQTNQLRTQERYTILSPVYSRGEVGLLTSIEFLLENWETYGNLNAGFGGVNPLYSDIVSMSAYVVNDNQKAKLQELVDVVKNSEFVPTTLQTSVDANVQANEAWLTANREPIVSWVSTFRNGSPAMSASIIAIALCFLVATLF